MDPVQAECVDEDDALETLREVVRRVKLKKEREEQEAAERAKIPPPQPAIMQIKATLSRKIAFPFLAGVLLRLVLFAMGLHGILSRRPELTGPTTSLNRIVEAQFIADHSTSAYDGSLLHQPPLVLLFFSPLSRALSGGGVLGSILLVLYFVVLDCLVAVGLYVIAIRASDEDNGEDSVLTRNRGLIVVSVYMFLPFSVLSCVSGSTVILLNVCLVWAIAFAAWGEQIPAVVCVVCAAYQSLFPIAFVIPVALAVRRAHSLRSGGGTPEPWKRLIFENALYAYGTAVALLFCSWKVAGDYRWIDSSFGLILTADDLMPNVGLFWYLLTEVFDVYRQFFAFALHFVPNSTVLPIIARLRDTPILTMVILSGVFGVFKSYPVLGDSVIHLSLLVAFPSVLKNGGLAIGVPGVFVSAALFPLFWNSWIVIGSGNANFFYAASVIFVFFQTGILHGMISQALSSAHEARKKNE